MIGCQFRFHPLLAHLKTAIEGGVLGRIVGASANWGEYLPSWHPWEDHRASYSARRDLGGGVILTLIHPLDYLFYLFGSHRRIHAMATSVPSLGTPAGEDWCNINVRYANGILAHVHLDYLDRPGTHTLQVTGDAGRADCDFIGGSLHIHTANGVAHAFRVPESFERNVMFENAMEHFLACVCTRAEPCVPLWHGIEVLRAALDSKRSAGKDL